MADGIHVQHRLGGVLVLAVPGIQYRYTRAHVLGKEMGAAAVLVANHEHVDLHRFQILQRIEQRLPFDGSRGIDIQAQNIGRQALLCKFEGRARAGTGFKKKGWRRFCRAESAPS